MKFDEKLLDLSKTIHQTSIISFGSKENPKKQIDQIKNMIREFIRMEVVPYELTAQEKLSFVIDNEYKITCAVLNGHRANDRDEFQATRVKIEKYRKELKIIS